MKALVSDVEAKLVILLSEISNCRICEGFMKKVAEDDDYARIHVNIINRIA